MRIGISGLGAYIPRRRLVTAEIGETWKHNITGDIIRALQVHERSVPGVDEDVNTMAVMAAKDALLTADISPAAVNVLYLGTRTGPYTARPSSTFLLEALGIPNRAFTADLHNDDRSGMAALQAAVFMIESGMADNALTVGSDTITSYGYPGNFGEYTAAAGAAGIVITNAEEKIKLGIEKIYSRYDKNLANCFGQYERIFFSKIDASTLTSYRETAAHIIDGIILLIRDFFTETGYHPSHFNYAVFQQPDGHLPQQIGLQLGFPNEQIVDGMVAGEIGDCGCASVLIGLNAVFERAKPHEKIFTVSFSKSGLDILILETTETSGLKPQGRKTVKNQLADKSMVSYPLSLKYEHKYQRVPYALSTFL